MSRTSSRPSFKAVLFGAAKSLGPRTAWLTEMSVFGAEGVTETTSPWSAKPSLRMVASPTSSDTTAEDETSATVMLQSKLVDRRRLPMLCTPSIKVICVSFTPTTAAMACLAAASSTLLLRTKLTNVVKDTLVTMMFSAGTPARRAIVLMYMVSLNAETSATVITESNVKAPTTRAVLVLVTPAVLVAVEEDVETADVNKCVDEVVRDVDDEDVDETIGKDVDDRVVSEEKDEEEDDEDDVNVDDADGVDDVDVADVVDVANVLDNVDNVDDVEVVHVVDVRVRDCPVVDDDTVVGSSVFVTELVDDDVVSVVQLEVALVSVQVFVVVVVEVIVELKSAPSVSSSPKKCNAGTVKSAIFMGNSCR